ncbi:hypothetical protein OS493_039824, partial [Desmophyllum pertusum]
PIRAIVAIIQVLLKMVLPSFTMLFLFIHMVYKTSKSTVASVESRAKMRGKMTRMIGTACIILIICFAPSQTNYALAMAGKVKTGHQTAPHAVTPGVHQQLSESIHLRAEQQELPPRIPEDAVSKV